MTKVYVVSAPSGTGKTTLNTRIMADVPNVEISVSYTSRPRRPNEIEGKHYHFVTRERFTELMGGGQMLEWAEVFGNLYGTSLLEVERIKASGRSVILEIDVQGWQSVQEKLPEAISIFILPPSLKSLWERLETRGTDPLDVRWRRLVTAKCEIEKGSLYQNFIINEQLDQAFGELKAFMTSNQPMSLSYESGVEHCKALLREFESSPFIMDLHKKLATP
jgi:guanylate kinase